MSDEVTEPEQQEAVNEPVEGAKDEPLREPGKKALIAERERREAAEKQAKELAARLKEIEDRDKTEEQKAQERLAAAERRAAEVEQRANRAEVAAAKQLPTELLAGPKSGSVEDLEAFAEQLIAWRGDKPRGPVIPTQGKTPSTTRDGKVAAFAEALGLD